MLKTIEIHDRLQIKGLFESFNPDHDCWVVSDLRTKFEMQKLILDKYGYFRDESVLRASDLWKILLRRTQPQIKIVSEAFIRTALRDFLDKNTEILQGINSSAEKTLMGYMDALAGIMLHPNGASALRDWFQENPDSAVRWQNWYIRAEICFRYLIYGQKIISPKWVVSFLQNELNLNKVWNFNLTVDLGADMSSAEAEVLKMLSQTSEVSVVKPVGAVCDQFSYLFDSYRRLESAQIERPKEKSFTSKKKVEVHRLASGLAEVKWAVAKVSSWLKEGVEPSQIAIIAPDIELYWPALKSFLDVESIAVQKNITTKLQSFAPISVWLSQLRVKSHNLNTSDLELATYSRENIEIKYEKFKALFQNLYSERDLERDSSIHKLFSTVVDNSALLNSVEFLAQSLSFWQGAVTEELETVFKEVLSTAPRGLRLSWSQWLKYLETIVSQKEVTLFAGQPGGVHCTKIQSAASFGFNYRIFIGLADENLKVGSSLQLTQDEYFLIQIKLGFTIENPDISTVDFDLRFVAKSESVEDCYIFANSDFDGKVLSPAAFWLEQEKTIGRQIILEESLITKWDLLQTSLPVNNLRLEEDMGRKGLAQIPYMGKRNLSPSAIEDYYNCPFIFAAKRLFKLEDYPEIDVDLDPRTNGTLAHALFESLINEPFTADVSLEEIDSLLESIKSKLNLVMVDLKLWGALKAKYKNLALRFLQAEKQRRAQLNQQFKTAYKELALQFYYLPKTGQVSLEEVADAWAINCRIDRVDSDGRHLVVIDYKSSTSSAPPLSKWIDDKKLQMLLYMWAIESLGEKFENQEVIGLFYYIFRTFELKGFQVNEKAGTLYEQKKSTSRSKYSYDQSSKTMLMDEFKQLFDQAIQNIELGAFMPKPADLKQCSTCQWRNLCRASHLMV